MIDVSTVGLCVVCIWCDVIKIVHLRPCIFKTRSGEVIVLKAEVGHSPIPLIKRKCTLLCKLNQSAWRGMENTLIAHIPFETITACISLKKPAS